MSSIDLPQDVVIDILSRLRVKTLIRFRCVCKPWYATITHPCFITTHLSRACSSYSDGYLQYMEIASSEKHRWCLLSDHAYVSRVEFEIPFNRRPYSFPRVVGSLNGIVCLSDRGDSLGSILYLWNPSIRKFKTLPSAPTHPQLSGRNTIAFHGFGFHPQTNDYKVVRILHFKDNNWQYIEGAPPQAEVYTLSTDSWRKIEQDVQWIEDQFIASSAFINGSEHWVVELPFNKRLYKRVDKITSFDFGDEVFREMKLPNYAFDGVFAPLCWPAVLKGSLSLLVYSRDYQGCVRYYIWVMREYGVVESWTKQFIIVLPQRVIQHFTLRFTKNNELLFPTEDGGLLCYDLESLTIKFLETHWSRDTTSVLPFMETLALLEEGDEQSGKENSFDGIRSRGDPMQVGKEEVEGRMQLQRRRD